jgi:hypothetical protein
VSRTPALMSCGPISFSRAGRRTVNRSRRHLIDFRALVEYAAFLAGMAAVAALMFLALRS